ncbi:MAG: hypothetical protein GXP55_06905 [Deltaproteobacteria bacterium]|nr:hypothetical protein [Deltaproteobacteria bacterium]
MRLFIALLLVTTACGGSGQRANVPDSRSGSDPEERPRVVAPPVTPATDHACAADPDRATEPVPIVQARVETPCEVECPDTTCGDAGVCEAEDPQSSQPDPVAERVIAPQGVRAADRACRVDADCRRVPGDCCGCTAGGLGAVVSRRRLAAVRARRTAACGRLRACPEVMSTDPTCIAVRPACVDRLCELVRN